MIATGPSTQTDLPPIDDMTWDQLPPNFLNDSEFDFDPQAFFSDYMVAEIADSEFGYPVERGQASLPSSTGQT